MIKTIKKKIQKTIPMHLYNRLMIALLALGILCFVLVGVFAFWHVEPQPYSFDDDSLLPYYSLKVDSIEKIGEHYYLVENGDYIHIYYNDQPLILEKVKSVAGVETIIDNEVLQEAIPLFQKKYPDLDIETVDDVMEYTGNVCLDATMPPLSSAMTFSAIFGVVFMISALWIKLVVFGYSVVLGKSIKTIIAQQKGESLLQQLEHPIHRYEHLKLLLCDDFLVVNHPVPFAMAYSDMTWVYVEKSFLNPEIRLVIYDQSLKRHRSMYVSSLFKGNKKDATIFLSQLSDMQPSLLVGYTDENNAKFKELKKS